MTDFRMDAGEEAYFARELEARRPRSYDIIRAPLKAFELIPVDTTTNAGADTISYSQFDMHGMAKIIANYADDLPVVGITGKEFLTKVRTVGDSYVFSVQDLKAAIMANKPLQSRLQSAAQRAQREKWNRIAFYGDAEYDLPGLLTNTNIPSSSAPAGASTDTEWSGKTADEILADMQFLVDQIITTTNGAEQPDTIVMPIANYRIASTLQKSTASDVTVLEFFKKNNPTISVEWANELTAAQMAANGVTRFSGSVMLAYRRSPEVLVLDMPQMYTEMAPQLNNLMYKVPAYSRIGGVSIFYPLAMSFMDSI